MKRTIILLFFFLFYCLVSFTQTVSFVRNFKVWNEWSMHNFQQTSDGGYILSTDAVYEMDSITQVSKGYLIKMNNLGTTQWIKSFNKSMGSVKPSDGCSVFQCSDAGYIISATEYTAYGVGILQLLRTDASGNLQWIKQYPGLGVSEGNCVRQTSDGGYVVAGYTMDLQNPVSYPYILKTDATGNPQFGKIFYEASGYSGVFYSVKQSSDGGYILCGSISAAFPFVMKLNSAGSTQWISQFNYSSGGGDLFDIIENAGGGYTATGQIMTSSGNYYDLGLIHFDPTGAILWDKYYSGSNSTSGFSLKETSNGNMIVAAFDNYYEALIYFDQNGQVLWAKKYANDFNEIPMTVERTTDNGFAFSGIEYGNGWNSWHVFINKTDSNGSSLCGDTLFSLTNNTASYSINNSMTVVDSFPQLTVNKPFHNELLIENTMCYFFDSTSAPLCEKFHFIPNVFTPNGDFQNEVFRDSVVTCDRKYEMKIYDRWGSLVFSSSDDSKHWNGVTSSGAEASEGTYYYVLRTSEETFKGFLTLLR